MQLSLPILDLSEAIEGLAQGGEEDRGAVFTRREVVNFMMDLAGYTADQPLHTFQVLEPSFGLGDFLIPIAERLLSSYFSQDRRADSILYDLGSAIRAVEIHHKSVCVTKAKLLHLLAEYEIAETDADNLLDQWIVSGDFLLTDFKDHFTHIIGNPPYVRQEMIPPILLAEYRSRFSTLYDRADLYVPFIEKCLHHLSAKGSMSFICADRWMKNKYGGPLRSLVSAQFHLACYIDMVDTPAFLSEVNAYPAITLINREPAGITRIARQPKIEKDALSRLATQLRADLASDGSSCFETANIAELNEPWILKSSPQLKIVRKLESQFPTIEEAGCKVGIGVATGADKIYTGALDSLDVEPSRKLPLIKTADIKTGKIKWHGQGLVNPFADDGSLVDLDDFPKLAAYLSKHAEAIKNRNCAQRNPNNWYRTIDRITPSLLRRPKLLIPDIKGDAHIVYDAGHYYPHHNLYFITSQEWDLRALQKVLKSGIARLFVSLYSTQMRGGYMRFQAQYLRRIRLPPWRDVPEKTKLILAAEPDQKLCNIAIFDLYGLTSQERDAINTQP